ncbi:MAG: hypothetical protein EPO35_10635, partial [Acidobacteria bacterium]
MRRASLLIEHLDQLYTVAGPGPRAGRRQGDITATGDGAVACDANGVILAAGTTADVHASVDTDDRTIIVNGFRPRGS